MKLLSLKVYKKGNIGEGNIVEVITGNYADEDISETKIKVYPQAPSEFKMIFSTNLTIKRKLYGRFVCSL